MGRIINSIFVIVIFGVIISCNATKTNDWKKYQVGKDEIIYLKINVKDSTYIAHWLISGKENEIFLYGKITFLGKFSELNSERKFILDGKIKSNEIKISDGRVISYPIDQNPNLTLDTKTNSLSFFGKKVNVDNNGNQDELNTLIEKFEKWEGNSVSLGE